MPVTSTALHREPSAHSDNGSKDAWLNYKENTCILFRCNAISHLKSRVHQLSSRKIICNSNTLFQRLFQHLI